MIDKVTRVERHVIRRGHYNYDDVVELCHLCKNLYNYVNYILRQSFFNTGIIPSEFDLINLLSKQNQSDYRALPAHVSCQVIRLVSKAWKSFFKALGSYKIDKSRFTSKPKVPRYKRKDGYFVAVFTNQSIGIKQGCIHFVRQVIKPIKTKISSIKQVRVIPCSACFIVEVVYEKDIRVTKKISGSVASIDLGLNNFVTFLHQASSLVVKALLSRKIETLVIRYNEGWKQQVNLGKRINQQFVQIPFKVFIDKLVYKCEDFGIRVVVTEESYTSKVDHLVGEEMNKHKKYLGRRVHRGLFKSSTGVVLNADVNGALGIMRKVFSESAKRIVDSGVAYTPIVVHPINCHKVNNIAFDNCIRLNTIKKVS